MRVFAATASRDLLEIKSPKDAERKTVANRLSSSGAGISRSSDLSWPVGRGRMHALKGSGLSKTRKVGKKLA